jgi:type I restriction enzyme, S subunit
MDMRRGFTQTDAGVIPDDWHTATLGSLTTLMTNGFVGTVTSHYTTNDTGVLYIQGYNVEENSFNFHGIKYVSEAFHKNHMKSCLRGGDLLTIQTGEIGLTTVVPESLAGSNCHALIISRLDQKKDSPRFISYYLNSDPGRLRLRLIETGTTMKHLNVGDMLHFPVPLPPTKAEQEAIANALSDADGLIKSLEQLLAKKRHVKQGVMQELLTGKKRLPGFGIGHAYKQSEVGIIPQDWDVRRLGNLLACPPAYGINAPAVPFDSRHPTYLRITDISDYGWFNIESKASVTHALSANYLLSEGDLVLARTGASVGKSYLYDRDDGNLVFAGFLIRVRPDPTKLNPAYLNYFTHSSLYWRWIRENSMRSGQPGVNGQEYATLPIPLPPTMGEQRCIATILSDMDAEIAVLGAKLAKARCVKQGMMQELLTGRTRLI